MVGIVWVRPVWIRAIRIEAIRIGAMRIGAIRMGIIEVRIGTEGGRGLHVRGIGIADNIRAGAKKPEGGTTSGGTSRTGILRISPRTTGLLMLRGIWILQIRGSIFIVTLVLGLVT